MTCETAPNDDGYTCAEPDARNTSTYTYNGEGLRVDDDPAGGSSQQFVWNDTGSIPELLSDGTNDYIYGPAGPTGTEATA
jgi:hypothetical protein